MMNIESNFADEGAEEAGLGKTCPTTISSHKDKTQKAKPQ